MRPGSALALACLHACLAAAQEDRSAVSGTIHDAVSGAPVRKIKVVLQPAGGRTTYMTQTDPAGAFSFDAVEPGPYRLGLQDPGYCSKPSTRGGALLRLQDGQKLGGLELTAVPTGSITGVVIGADGEPEVGAIVNLFHRQWWYGKRIWVHGVFGTADDLGSYRFDGLEPGEYLVRAGAAVGWYNIRIVSDGPGEPEMAMLGVTSTVTVRAGQEASSGDLRLRLERTYHVRGKVDAKLAATSPLAVDTKSPYVLATMDEFTSFMSYVDPRTSSFDIAGVPPGTYQVQMVPYSSTAPARIESGDAEGVQLVWAEFHMRIRRRFEGEPSHNLSRIGVTVESADRKGQVHSTIGGEVISNLLPGRYILRVHPNEPAYVKRMLLDGREITTPDFELMGPDDELEIVMAAPTHDVIGRFAWPEPAPVNASVILVPEQPRSGDYEIVHHTDLDQNGDFTFDHISPGRYRAFVVTRYDAGLWENRDLFRQVADRGTLVEVPEGASGPDAIRITPKLLPAAVLDHAVARIGN